MFSMPHCSHREKCGLEVDMKRNGGMQKEEETSGALRKSLFAQILAEISDC